MNFYYVGPKQYENLKVRDLHHDVSLGSRLRSGWTATTAAAAATLGDVRRGARGGDVAVLPLPDPFFSLFRTFSYEFTRN